MYERRGYTKNQINYLGFPTGEYDFPTGDGSFIGTLVMKKWNNRKGLICYFDTNDGNKYKLIVWFHRDVNRSYCPLHSKVDMSYTKLGTVIKVGYTQTRNNKSKWLTAEVLGE